MNVEVTPSTVNSSGCPSATSNISGGFNLTNVCVRSVLINPFVGLPLTAFLNEVAFPYHDNSNSNSNSSLQQDLQALVPDEYKKLLNHPDQLFEHEHMKALISAFEEVASNWIYNETWLTGGIAEKLGIKKNKSLGNTSSQKKRLGIKRVKCLSNTSSNIGEHSVENIAEKFGISIGIENEKQVTDKEDSGKVDFIFSEKNDIDKEKAATTTTTTEDAGKVDSNVPKKSSNTTTKTIIESKRSVVAIVEFGVNIQEWWKKQHQILKYVKFLAAEKKGYKFDKPMLLIVISVDSKKDDGNKKRYNKNRKYSKFKGDDYNTPFQAKFGVFLCTPKSTTNVDNTTMRLALLYRKQSTTLGDASKQFAKVFFAAEICAKLRDGESTLTSRIIFKYLGPNCCRFGNKIFRCYDTRFRDTDRRPDIYKSEKVFRGDDKYTTILEILDQPSIEGEELHAFGTLFHPTNKSKHWNREWLWKFRGNFLIISTPYREGRHYAKKQSEFLPIIDHLKLLHENNFVHGDIRAYNMILSDNGSWLIDFDFGGEVGKVKYPRGYKPILIDGVRIGEYEQEITMEDDWVALFNVIIGLYTFNLQPEYVFEDLLANQNFLGSINSVKVNIQCGKINIQEIREILIRVSSLPANYSLSTTVGFHGDLIKNRFLIRNENQEGDEQPQTTFQDPPVIQAKPATTNINSGVATDTCSIPKK